MRNKTVTIGGRSVKYRPSISAVLIYRHEFNESMLSALRSVIEGKEDASGLILRVLWALAANADEETLDYVEFIRTLSFDDSVAMAIHNVIHDAAKALLDIPRRPVTDNKGKQFKKRGPSACPDLELLAISSSLGLGMREWRDLRASDVIDIMIDAHGLSHEREGTADEVKGILDSFTVVGEVKI